MLILVLAGGAAKAQTSWRYYENIAPESFFDFERAKGFWNTLKTRQQLDAYIAQNCPVGGPYDAWRLAYSRDQVKAKEALKVDPNAERIKRCHDLQLVFYKWNGAVAWAHTGTADWNKWPDDSYACQTFKEGNIFTHRCTDVPFWFKSQTK